MAMERSDFLTEADWHYFLLKTNQLHKLRLEEALDHVNDHSNWFRNSAPEREPVSHYGSDTGIECIDAIRAMGASYDFSRGNAVKYLWRAGRKEGNSALGDLKKARTYINFMIEELESGGEDG